MIKVDQVSKTFGRIKAVDALSFEVSSGEIAAFLGPNGSGKTTTMRMIMGFLKTDRGSISIANETPESHIHRQLHLGYLPENTPLYPDLTVLEYLEFSARVRGVERSKRTSQIRLMVSQCGLRSHLDRPISQLSKGYKQRVGLAQALIHDPPILVLDEPTTGLDPMQVHDILQLIRRLGENKTILLSTHILHHVPVICDRVLVIGEGQLKYDGTAGGFAGLDPIREVRIATPPTSQLLSDLKQAGFSSIDEIETPNGPGLRISVKRSRKHGELLAVLDGQVEAGDVLVAPPSLDRAFRRLIQGESP